MPCPALSRAIATIHLTIVAASGVAAAEEARTTSIRPEEVLVVGERPGPRLWRVSSGAHVLWILGTQTPLPRGFDWRSEEVEAVIARSNEVLGAYSVSLSAPRQRREARGALSRSLPRRVARRWLELKAEYVGSEVATDNLLPTEAALLLRTRALERHGLVNADEIWLTIYTTAQRRGVPIRALDFVVRPDDAQQRSSTEAEKAGVRYLVRTMDRLEKDLAEARARADAWVAGEMEAIRTLARTDESYATLLAYSWPFVDDDETGKLLRDAENRLATAVERALSRNDLTFAAFPMHLLLKDGGLLARLRASGYVVEQPH